jgi:hypothetical protein
MRRVLAALAALPLLVLGVSVPASANSADWFRDNYFDPAHGFLLAGHGHLVDVTTGTSGTQWVWQNEYTDPFTNIPWWELRDTSDNLCLNSAGADGNVVESSCSSSLIGVAQEAWTPGPNVGAPGYIIRNLHTGYNLTANLLANGSTVTTAGGAPTAREEWAWFGA